LPRRNIDVGYLSRNLSESDLREAFAAFDEVASSLIIKDKFSGESLGFGFAEMPNKEEADKAIASMSAAEERRDYEERVI
jgi:RNA recognition motif-containing protein